MAWKKKIISWLVGQTLPNHVRVVDFFFCWPLRSPQIDYTYVYICIVWYTARRYPYVVGVERCVSEHNLPQKWVKHVPLYAQNSIQYSRTSSNFMLIFLCRRLFKKKWMSKKMVVCSLGWRQVDSEIRSNVNRKFSGVASDEDCETVGIHFHGITANDWCLLFAADEGYH